MGRRERGARAGLSPGHSAARGALDAAEDGDDLAEDGGVVTGDRRVGGVVRHEPDVVVRPLERLDGGLAVEHRGNDVPVVRDGLLPDHDPVAVRDRGVDHGVTGDLQQEQRPGADQLPGQREDVLDGLLGEDRATGGDPADERHVRGVLRRDVERGWFHFIRVRADGRVPGQAYLYGARAAGVPAQVTLALQGRELVRDAG